jgi:hypothetical protein
MAQDGHLGDKFTLGFTLVLRMPLSRGALVSVRRRRGGCT